MAKIGVRIRAGIKIRCLFSAWIIELVRVNDWLTRQVSNLFVIFGVQVLH